MDRRLFPFGSFSTTPPQGCEHKVIDLALSALLNAGGAEGTRTPDPHTARGDLGSIVERRSSRTNVHQRRRLALSPWMTARPRACLPGQARLGTAFLAGRLASSPWRRNRVRCGLTLRVILRGPGIACGAVGGNTCTARAVSRITQNHPRTPHTTAPLQPLAMALTAAHLTQRGGCW
jgi:hypothetical protein